MVICLEQGPLNGCVYVQLSFVLLPEFVIQVVSDGVVLLKGKAGERLIEFSISVNSIQNLSPADAALPIHRLAAKAQIKQLEDAEKGELLFCLDFSSLHLFLFVVMP